MASILNETSLMNDIICSKDLNASDVINHFRYFVIDHSILLALLEEPVKNDQGNNQIYK